MRIRPLLIALLFATCCITAPVSAGRSVGSIELSANPDAIAADGKSTTTIIAEVRDRDGKFVPDGTEVHFTASLGVIEDVGATSAGVARVKLVSSDIPGSCIVTAAWAEGQAAARITVEFGERAPSPRGPEYIEVAADEYLAYSADYKVIEALGNVRIRHRNLELEAHEAQIDLDRNRVVARSLNRSNPLKVHTATEVLNGDLFASDLSSSSALLLSSDLGGVRRINLASTGSPLVEGEVVYQPEEFDFKDITDSGILVRAREAVVFVNDRIQFHRAAIFVDGKRMISFPFYVFPLTGFLPEDEQYLGYSTGGLRLSLPLYYSLSPSLSGAFLIRHGESTGWGDYGQKPGWFIDMQQKYSTERSRGKFVLSRVTSDDWGAHLSHSQSLGDDAQAFLYLEYPAHQDLYGALNLSKSFNNLDIGLNLDGSRFRLSGAKSLHGDVYVQTRARDLGKTPLKYTVSARFDRSYTWIEAADPQSDLGTSDTQSTQRIEANIYSKPLSLLPNLSFRGSAGLGYVWGDSGLAGMSSRATAVLDYRLSRTSNLELSYRYTDRPNLYVTTRIQPTPDDPRDVIIRELQNRRQVVSANLRLRDPENRWYAAVYAMKGLDYDSLTVFGDFSYRLSPDWRLGLRSTMNDYGSLSYNDLEVMLGKTFGNRELIAVWSQSQNKIMFELGSAGF